MKYSLSLLLILLLVPGTGVITAQSDVANSGTVSFIVTGSDNQSLLQVDDAAWKIEPVSQRNVNERQFTLHAYSVVGDTLADQISFFDIPIDLEIGTYTVAPTRGPADLYATARIQGSPVNPRGTFTVEAVNAEHQTFSGTFSVQIYRAGSDSEVTAVITGMMIGLPLIPLSDCQASGTNANNQFTFRVSGSAVIESFDLPSNEGTWKMETYPTFIDGASPWLKLVLQDQVDSQEGLRLEISRIPLDDPAGIYASDPEDENGLVVSLENRGAFQLNLADEGTIKLTIDEKGETLSGELNIRILALDGTVEAKITGSFMSLPLPTGLCIIQNYIKPAS